jgi:ABC-type glycerol-3-phosphate transport system substrate-binding protein
MKTSKRYLFVFAILVVALLVLAACAGGTEAPPAEPAPVEEPAAELPKTEVPAAEKVEAPEVTEPAASADRIPVTVLSMGADWLLGSLWDSSTGDETALLTEFEDKHGIDVIFEGMPEDAARQKTMLDLSSHTAQYDIITTGVWSLATYASAGYLESLDDWMANHADPDYFGTDDYLPVSMEGSSYEGQIYALPLYTFGPALVYNKALFEEYDVKVPKTMEELEEAAEKLTLDLDGDGKTDVYGITMRARRGEEPTIDVTGMSWAYGGSWFEGNASTAEEIRARSICFSWWPTTP